MKIAYLILAHRNPRLIKRLIGRLSCEDSAFFLHIDAKSPIDEFLSAQGPNVHFTERRVAVYWAEYSMVTAILTLIEQAIAAPQQFDYYILLSGSDYPLRSREYIHDFFRRSSGTEYISLAPIPTSDAGVPLSKITRYAVPSTQPLLNRVVRAAARLGLANRDYRRHLGALTPFAGSTWWSLTREACLHMLNFARENPDFCRFFEHTITPDESFFHTILGNSSFRPNIRKSLMYDDWSAGSMHPSVITPGHLDAFDACDQVTLPDWFGDGELLFARKFSDDGADLLDRLDQIIDRKDGLAASRP